MLLQALRGAARYRCAPLCASPLPRFSPPSPDVRRSQSRPARSRQLHARALPRARRRRLRQDARDHAQDRAPDPGRARARSRSPPSPSPTRRAAEMRERAKELIGARRRKHVVICTFHALGVRMMREDGARAGPEARSSASSTATTSLSILKDAGGTTDDATARIWQWTISQWKNMGLNAAQAAKRRPADDNERITAPHHGALRGAPRRLPERGLRRPDRPAAQAAAKRRRGAREVAGRAAATCWSTNTRTPTPRQYELLKRAGRRARPLSPRWATTTSRSTAGAAPRSTT